MSLGDWQAFIQYSRQCTQPLTQAAGMMNLVQSGVASAERVFELLDAPEQSAEPATPARPPEVRGHVAFEDVSFRYDPARPLIDGLSLEESERLLDRLWAHCTEPKLAYAHKWRQGDILVWDNRSVIHRRDSFDPKTRRIMLRTQIKGEPPLAAKAA